MKTFVLCIVLGSLLDHCVFVDSQSGLSEIRGLAQPFLRGFTKLSDRSNDLVNTLVHDAVTGALKIINKDLIAQKDTMTKSKQSIAAAEEAFKKLLSNKENQLLEVISSTFKQLHQVALSLKHDDIHHEDGQKLRKTLETYLDAHHGQVDALIDDMKIEIKEVESKFQLQSSRLQEKVASFFQRIVNVVKQITETTEKPLEDTLTGVLKIVQTTNFSDVGDDLEKILQSGEKALETAAKVVEEEVNDVTGHSF